MKIVKRKVLIVCILLLLIIICISIYYSCNVLTISNYDVVSYKIGKEFNDYKILQLSDLHNKYYGKDGYELIKEIDNINPDIIVMTGDMVNSKDTDYTIFFNIAYNISKKYNVYYIIGNHEKDLNNDNREKIFDELKSYGIIVLDNDKIQIQKNDKAINIYGLSYDLNKDSREFNRLLSSINTDEFNILLAHNPLYFDEYAKYSIDLVISGHVHGGIIRLPFLNGILSPNETLFPKYSKGKYQIDNSILIVNAGVGIGRMPIRLFNPLDISLIILRSIDK